MVAGAVSPESELLSFMMLGLSDSFFSMLFEKEHPDLSEIALRFMRGTVINTQQFQSTIIKFLKVEDDITRESAYLGLLRSRKGNENWKDGSSYFLWRLGIRLQSYRCWLFSFYPTIRKSLQKSKTPCLNGYHPVARKWPSLHCRIYRGVKYGQRLFN
jgi:hypothetical protein